MNNYCISVICQGSVFLVLRLFLQVKLQRCDSPNNQLWQNADTIGAIVGSFAEAYYPISTRMKEKAFGWFGGGNDNGVKGFMDVFH